MHALRLILAGTLYGLVFGCHAAPRSGTTASDTLFLYMDKGEIPFPGTGEGKWLGGSDHQGNGFLVWTPSGGADSPHALRALGNLPKVWSARTIAVVPMDWASSSGAEGLVTVRHQVQDFDRWLQSFLKHRDHRGHGDRGYRAWGHSVYRDADFPDRVFVSHFAAPLQPAVAYMDHPHLRTAMAKSGVLGQPDIRFVRLRR